MIVESWIIVMFFWEWIFFDFCVEFGFFLVNKFGMNNFRFFMLIKRSGKSLILIVRFLVFFVFLLFLGMNIFFVFLVLFLFLDK